MKEKNYILLDEKSIFIDERVKIGENVIIYENNRIDGDSVICDNVTIYPNSFIVNSIIGKGSKIYSSYIENSHIGARNIINSFSSIKRVVSETAVVVPPCSEVKNIRLKKLKNKNTETSIST